MAQQEDEWDVLVNTHAGRNVDAEDEKVRWVDAIKMSERENQVAYEKDLAKDRGYIRKMQRIVDLETKLALEEGQTVIRGRKKRPLKVIKPPKPGSQ